MPRRPRRRPGTLRAAPPPGRPRRRLATIAGGLVLAAVVVKGVSALPSTLARIPLFQVKRVEFRGMEFMDEANALAVMDLAPGASVWDDLGAWEALLLAHPLVDEVEVRRALPSTLVVSLEERRPVALFPMTTLEPVDAVGQVLPIDPASRGLDLPILDPELAGRPGEFLTPGQRRFLAEETARLDAVDPRFMSRVSKLTLGPDQQVVARLGQPDVEVLFRAPVPPSRIRQAMDALDDAMARFPGEAVHAVDLRFQEQVVVRFERRGRS